MLSDTLEPWPWHTSPAVLIDAIVARLRTAMHDEPVYLIVDPLMGEPEIVQLPIDAAAAPEHVMTTRAHAWQRDVHSMHSKRFEPRRASGFPYLVRLAGTSDPLLRASVMWAIDEHLRACAIGEGTYRFGGWLQAFGTSAAEDAVDVASTVDAEGARLARHLSTAIEARGAHGRCVPLRITDRRALHTLQASACIDWRLVTQGVQRWCYLDHNLELRTLDGSPGPVASRGAWNGTSDRWIADCAAINRTQTFLLGRTFPLTAPMLAAIAPKLAAARARGLHDIADMAAFASEAILEPGFEAWDGLNAMVAHVLQTHQDLTDAIASKRSRWATRRQDHERETLS